jgi:integrase
LAKPHYATFDTKAEAVSYARQIEAMLDQGTIPQALQTEGKPKTFGELIARYKTGASISPLDHEVLSTVYPELESIPLTGIHVAWAREWVTKMKREKRLAPGTIRKRVGAVSRCLEWYVQHDEIAINPLRQLPRGYANYAPADGEARKDVERDRRLHPDEEVRIRLVLARDLDYIRSIGRERPISDRHIEAWCLLFDLALETAMRLQEMYTLTVNQVDLPKKTIFLDKTKNGSKRQVPLTSVAIKLLDAYLRNVNGVLLFPFWDGKTESLKRTTYLLSSKWRSIAMLAQCEDLRFHDLRHEAVCRLYERTQLTDVQIARITGHKQLSMLRRYASLRGSDLADSLW